MGKLQLPGVERLTAKLALHERDPGSRSLPFAVELIAENGVPGFAQMNPDLVGATRHELNFEQSGTLESLTDGECRFGRLTHLHFSGEPLPIHRMAAEEGREGGPLHRPALNDRQVRLADAARFECSLQRDQGLLVLGHHQAAGGVLVEAVNQTRPQLRADSRPRATAVKQSIDQRPLPVSGAGMDDHSGLLVEDDDVLVLVEHVQRDVLRHQFGWRGRWQGKLDGLSSAKAARRLGGLSVDLRKAGIDQRLEARPGDVRKRRGQVLIQALAARFHWNAMRSRLFHYQIFDFTCALERTTMSTTARSKKFVFV